MFQTTNSGGSEILRYDLYRNEGGVSTDYSKVETYDGNAPIHTLTIADDGIEAGIIYKLRVLAVNIFGASDLSDEVNAGVSSFPAKPDSVTKNELESTQTAITLEWQVSDDTELAVIGYVLKINDGTSEDYTTVYYGLYFPNVRKFLVSGLETGNIYSFTVQALNFNGPSEPSDAASFIICQSPSQFGAPTMADVTRTSMTITWLAPVIDGGCPIYTYSLY